MAKLFGGKDPFDHPFFTQPFGGLFGGKDLFDDPFFTRPFDRQPGSARQITIQELNPDSDSENGVQSKDVSNKEQVVKNPTDYASGTQSFIYQRVAYGGLDGVYYSSSTGKMTGGDGVVLMEMKEEDKIVGESLHTLSKGIHDKGHSVTTKHSSDGRVNSLQTLHNLNEDELASFEENWKITAEKNLPGWNNGFNLLDNSGSDIGAWNDFPNWSGWGGWALPSLEYFGNGGESEPNDESHGRSPRGRSRKVVPVE
ncbi:Calcium-binding EF-hand family protein [Forsythia ovata]|uniref:Calcium-binding EF-hand family protein n=1 Tax=Forsythia ovata TaxID=205694 RepID=A0ABD1VH21_9LAMI